jgi:hypothetical protein
VVARRSTGDQVAVVDRIEWHFKDERHLYFLSFEGKSSARRYDQDEISTP